MKLSDLSEVSDLDDRLQNIDRQRQLLTEKAEVTVTITGITDYREIVDGGSKAGAAVLQAVTAYLDWLRTDIHKRLKECGVEA
jgi:hypothetical protein